MHREKGILRERLLIGAIAGTVGTWAMTVAAKRLFRRLPDGEQYPLPPREITEAMTEPGRSRSPERVVAVRTLAAHFTYGAACGSLFTMAGLHESRPVMKGIVWGTAVWTVSYLGILPALQVLKPATAHPMRRNALMLAVHFVWGGAVGIAAATLRSSMGPLRSDEQRTMPDTAKNETT